MPCKDRIRCPVRSQTLNTTQQQRIRLANAVDVSVLCVLHELLPFLLAQEIEQYIETVKLDEEARKGGIGAERPQVLE